jgi:hypothetical protein
VQGDSATEPLALTRMSIPPKRSTAAATAASMEAWGGISDCHPSAGGSKKQNPYPDNPSVLFVFSSPLPDGLTAHSPQHSNLTAIR